MKTKTTILSMALLATTALSLPANANEVSELKSMMQKMSQQMEVMQKRINQLEAEKFSNIEPAAGHADSDIVVSLKPTPKFKSKDGSFEAKVIGFAQADAVFQNDDATDHPDSTTIKRARVGLAGKFLNDWGYKFLYDFGNNNNDQLQDMFITYNGLEDTQLIVGQYKEPIGLEWQSPSKYWQFMELPLTTALTPRRSVGAGFNTQIEDFRLNLGVFGENANKTRSDDEGYSFDGHFVYTPVHEKGEHIHVGASASYRVPDSASDAVTYSAKHETSSATANSLTTGAIAGVDSIMLGGLEALGIFGPFSAQAEYSTVDLDRDSANSLSFDSYYLQAAYMLTGESKKFNRKKHMFTKVKPTDPFSVNDGGIGAWEVAARYENLDLNDSTATFGEMDRYTLGLNWHPNMYTRFMLNYAMIDTDDNASIADDNSSVIGLRAQVDF